jgi:hypothetical protein
MFSFLAKQNPKGPKSNKMFLLLSDVFLHKGHVLQPRSQGIKTLGTRLHVLMCMNIFQQSWFKNIKYHLEMAGGRDELMAFLEKEGISTETVEHPEVFTVETMMEHLKDISGAVGKNLFLRDKKKKLWLLTTLHDREIDLKDIAKKVGAPGGLRFADEAILQEKLGVSQGCVTPLALFNDQAGDIKVILDSGFFNGGHERCYFHPMVNSASTGLTPDDLKKFVKATGHEAIFIEF